MYWLSRTPSLKSSNRNPCCPVVCGHRHRSIDLINYLYTSDLDFLTNVIFVTNFEWTPKADPTPVAETGADTNIVFVLTILPAKFPEHSSLFRKAHRRRFLQKISVWQLVGHARNSFFKPTPTFLVVEDLDGRPRRTGLFVHYPTFAVHSRCQNRRDRRKHHVAGSGGL